MPAGSVPDPERVSGVLPEAIDESAAADGMASDGIDAAPALPGSYLSPSFVHQMPAPEVQPPPVMPLSGTAAPSAPESATATTADVSTPSGVTPLGPEIPALRPGQAALFSDLPFDAPGSLAGWLVAVGSGVGALSFLLPWAPRIINYTNSWGLSSLANLPVLALLIATTVLAILPNRVPPWFRSGVLSLIGGSLFLGLLWPYILGDFGAEFGSILGAAAALVLVVGGTLAVAPNSERPPTG